MESISLTFQLTPDLPWSDRVLAGMALIRKYEPHATLAAEHDAIWFGSYDTAERMTEAERQLMDAWNWHEDTDSWHHFV